MKTTKGVLIASAVASLFVMNAASAQDKAAKDGKDTAGAVKCAGVNECKGKGACAGASNSCAGENGCKGKGWTKMSADDCKKKGGTVVTAKK
jgi:hypothetical protein